MTDMIQDQTSSQCPAYLPKKFWDDERREPRLEALAQSYREMESKMGAGMHKNIPNHHSEYCIECKSDLFSNDPVVNQRLHDAGFSHEQAQLVYDLAYEALEPLVAEIFAQLHSHNQIDRLCEKFGGEERWQETARQLQAWGSRKFGPQALEAMGSSYEGVMTLYDMMCKGEGEPGMDRFSETAGLQSESDIRKLMRDPKYWRDQDPATVEKVRAGFRRLYPN